VQKNKTKEDNYKNKHCKSDMSMTNFHI